jgi:hypothetical protein
VIELPSWREEVLKERIKKIKDKESKYISLEELRSR